jgi:hypothetical protein
MFAYVPQRHRPSATATASPAPHRHRSATATAITATAPAPPSRSPLIVQKYMSTIHLRLNSSIFNLLPPANCTVTSAITPRLGRPSRAKYGMRRPTGAPLLPPPPTPPTPPPHPPPPPPPHPPHPSEPPAPAGTREHTDRSNVYCRRKNAAPQSRRHPPAAPTRR